MKNPYKKINRRNLSLGDLVAIVGSCTRDNRETLATLVDLFESGRVCLKKGGRFKRVRISVPTIF